MLMNQVDTLHVGRYWSEAYAVSSRPSWVILRSRSRTKKFSVFVWLKHLYFVFKILVFYMSVSLGYVYGSS